MAVVQGFLALVRPVVQASAAGGGCAVAALTVGAGTDGDDTLRQVAATAFASWTGQLAERLTAAGLAPGEAADLAAMLITLLEGAHVMSRASGTPEPFDQAARAATLLTEGRYISPASATLPGGSPPAP
jgi:hypothetical protein